MRITLNLPTPFSRRCRDVNLQFIFFLLNGPLDTTRVLFDIPFRVPYYFSKDRRTPFRIHLFIPHPTGEITL